MGLGQLQDEIALFSSLNGAYIGGTFGTEHLQPLHASWQIPGIMWRQRQSRASALGRPGGWLLYLWRLAEEVFRPGGSQVRVACCAESVASRMFALGRAVSVPPL